MQSNTYALALLRTSIAHKFDYEVNAGATSSLDVYEITGKIKGKHDEVIGAA